MIALAGWAAAAFIAWTVFKLAVGYFTPAPVKGKRYFIDALRKCGAPPGLMARLNDGYIDAVVAEAISSAEVKKNMKMDLFHNALCQYLDYSARLTVSLAMEAGYANKAGGRLTDTLEYQELQKRGLVAQ